MGGSEGEGSGAEASGDVEILSTCLLQPVKNRHDATAKKNTLFISQFLRYYKLRHTLFIVKSGIPGTSWRRSWLANWQLVIMVMKSY